MTWKKISEQAWVIDHKCRDCGYAALKQFFGNGCPNCGSNNTAFYKGEPARLTRDLPEEKGEE